MFAVLVWYFLMTDISPFKLLLITFITFIMGVFTSNQVIKDTGKDDPPEVVIDELTGQWLALIGLPHSIGFAIASFIIFRILDIAKPYPINQLEELPQGWGVMLDDIAAGLITFGLINLYICLL